MERYTRVSLPMDNSMNFGAKTANARTDCFRGFVVTASHRILMYFYNRAIKHVPFVIAIFFFNSANITLFRPVVITIINTVPVTIVSWQISPCSTSTKQVRPGHIGNKYDRVGPTTQTLSAGEGADRSKTETSMLRLRVRRLQKTLGTFPKRLLTPDGHRLQSIK